MAINRLQGKVAVVTGGNGGIGLGTAKRFAEEGARVFVTARRREELDKAVAEIGNGATAIQADVTRMADLDRIIDVVNADAGRIDVLVLNAAFGEFLPLGRLTEEHYEATFDTNVKAVIFGLQKALPILSDGASVIVIGSVAASRAFANMAVYSATKGALRSFVRTSVVDLADRGIRVNLLSPGNVSTPALDRLVPIEHQTAAFLGKVLPRRLGQPIGIANAALFLASDESEFVNGAELVADGGLLQV